MNLNKILASKFATALISLATISTTPALAVPVQFGDTGRYFDIIAPSAVGSIADISAQGFATTATATDGVAVDRGRLSGPIDSQALLDFITDTLTPSPIGSSVLTGGIGDGQGDYSWLLDDGSEQLFWQGGPDGGPVNGAFSGFLVDPDSTPTDVGQFVIVNTALGALFTPTDDTFRIAGRLIEYRVVGSVPLPAASLILFSGLAGLICVSRTKKQA